jgi:threonine synthase
LRIVAETDGVFTETAGGVTAGVTRKLVDQGRIGRDETTVVCITGNGLKTTEALAGQYELEEPIAPRLAAFEEFQAKRLGGIAVGA